MSNIIVHKCDICHKEISSGDPSISAGQNSIFTNYLFCLSCAKPIYLFLKKHGFIKRVANKQPKAKNK